MERNSEKGKGESKRLIQKNTRMSLENYIDFLVSNKSMDFTVNFLDQIIHIHGYRKIKKTQKKTLIDAIATLDLIDPSRSTLTDNTTISSATTVSLEDVIADLKALDWQECCVTSIQTLNADKKISPSYVAAAVSGEVSSLGCVDVAPTEAKRNKRRKGLNMEMLCWIDGGEEQAKKPLEVKKKTREREREKKSHVAESGGGDGNGNGSDPSSNLVSLGSC